MTFSSCQYRVLVADFCLPVGEDHQLLRLKAVISKPPTLSLGEINWPHCSPLEPRETEVATKARGAAPPSVGSLEAFRDQEIKNSGNPPSSISSI